MAASLVLLLVSLVGPSLVITCRCRRRRPFPLASVPGGVCHRSALTRMERARRRLGANTMC